MRRAISAPAAALALALALCGCRDGTPTGSATPEDAGADAGAAPDTAPVPPRGPIRRDVDPAAMVSIPARAFAMGNPIDSYPADYWTPWAENEVPEHQVTLSAFAIDRDEVTVADYAAFLDAVGEDSHFHPLQPIAITGQGRTARYQAEPGEGARPMRFVTWFDAATYCAWAGKRLPTEAEWERAARGPKNTLRPWGESGPDCAHANGATTEQLCERGPVPAGARPAGDTPEGVRDMVGNVAEWVADRYDRYTPAPTTDPDGPTEGRYRVVRGGGFRDGPKELSSLSRWAAGPAQRSEGIGFRCAL